MKLSCKKCNKLLTEDLYLVNPKYNKGVTTNNKMFDKGKHVEVVYLSEVGQWKEVTGDSSGIEISGERETYFERGRFKKGIFSIFRTSKKNWNFEKSGIKGYQMTIKKVKRIAVSDRSILDRIIPAFKEGYGCCMGHGTRVVLS